MTPTAEGVLARWTAGPGDRLDADAALAIAGQLPTGPVRAAIETAARARRQLQDQHTRDLYAPYTPQVTGITMDAENVRTARDPDMSDDDKMRAIADRERRRKR